MPSTSSSTSSENPTNPNPILPDSPPSLPPLLSHLHALSLSQESTLSIPTLSYEQLATATADKFIALDADKCQLIYSVARASNAKTIVEAGTSYGVSTMYLGLAVSKNVEQTGGPGKVVATEHEPAKARQAREYWEQAGEVVGRHIELREGDLRETLREGLGTVDMLLLDIWAPMALPALKLVQPHLRHGATVFVDNTIASRERYKDLLEYLRAPASGFRNLTLPYSNGMDMCVYLPT